MAKSKIFLILCLSFIGGIAVASFCYPKIVNNFYLFVILIAAIIVITINHPHTKNIGEGASRNKPVVIFSFALLFFIFGIYSTDLKLEKINNLDENGKNISGNFIIQKEPETSGKMQRITLKNEDYKILATVFTYPEYSYGDEVRLSCALKIPRSFVPPGGTQDDVFDYRMYLAKDNILYECDKPKIELINSDKGNKIYSAILKLKNKLGENIQKLIPAPQSGLMIGLILGGDDKLSKDVQNSFSATGMTHIVAVSGYNVTIVAEYLMMLGIFIGLWRRQAFWFAVAGIILFIAMTGFPSSAVRAGVMGILLIWAMKNGRLANSQNAIIFAAVVMLLINPLLLRWDIGFQLSFLATLGIIYMYPVFQDYLIKRVETGLKPVSTLAEILFLTLSAQIFVLPVILFNFQKLSLISPLANLLVLPIIPLTMLLGFVAVTSSFIFYALAQIFSWLAYLPLKYETTVINYLANLKYSSIEVNLSWWGMAVWYIVIILVISALRGKSSFRA